jgi:leucyl-tRNA synthetase
MIMYLIHFQKRIILHEQWPIAGPVDDVLVKSSCYLMEAAHLFRIVLKNHTQPRKPSKGAGSEKPTHATIWVAKTFPPWQSTVLKTLKQLHDVSLQRALEMVILFVKCILTCIV